MNRARLEEDDDGDMGDSCVISSVNSFSGNSALSSIPRRTVGVHLLMFGQLHQPPGARANADGQTNYSGQPLP